MLPGRHTARNRHRIGGDRCAAFSPLVLGVALVLLSSTAAADDGTQITSYPGEDFQPSWSPDGSQIAFNSRRSGNFDIWVIPATGGTATQITTDPGMDASPTWSPDGAQLAFTSSRSGNWDVWVIPATGGTAIQITNDPAQDHWSAWSPDGNHLAFDSPRSGTWHIWVIPVPTIAVQSESWSSIKEKYKE